MAAISLGKTVIKVTVPAQSVTLTEVNVIRYVDLPADRIVRVFLKEIPGAMVLWEGDAYDSIGQWTDTQAQNRIKELLG